MNKASVFALCLTAIIGLISLAGIVSISLQPAAAPAGMQSFTPMAASQLEAEQPTLRGKLTDAWWLREADNTVIDRGRKSVEILRVLTTTRGYSVIYWDDQTTTLLSGGRRTRRFEEWAEWLEFR